MNRFRRLLALVLVFLPATIVLVAQARPVDETEFVIRPLQSFPGDWSGYRQLTGDVNGDGREDLIWNRVTDGTHNYTFVGLAGADGAFVQGPLNDFPGDWRVYRIYTGDFDGDGLTDLLWNSKCQDFNCNSSANYTAVGLSNGDGTFTLLATQQLGTAGWSAYRTRVADANGDGRDDVIFNYVGNGFGATQPGANYIYVATSGINAALTLGPLQTVGLTGWEYFNVTTGDVNKDGLADLVWATQCIRKYFYAGESCWLGQNNRVAVGLGSPTGFDIFPPQIIGTDGTWQGYEINDGDVNGDGRHDLVWQSPSGTDAINSFVGLGTDSGQFEVGEQQTGSATTYGNFFALLDVDGDGDDDLIANTLCQARDTNTFKCTAGRNLLTIGRVGPDGTVTYDPEQELPSADLENLGLSPRHPAADYNGDGTGDLLWSSVGPNGSLAPNLVLVGLAQPPEPVSFESYIPAAVRP